MAQQTQDAAGQVTSGRVDPIRQRQTKAQIIATIAQETGLPRRDVAQVLASLGNLIDRHLAAEGSGELTIPDTGIRIRRVVKRARAERRMVSPLIGTEVTVQARPERAAVKLTALKSLRSKVS